LAQGQREAGRGLGQVFTEHEHRVVAFHFADARGGQWTVLQQIADGLDIGQLLPRNTGVEIFGTDQFTQREVAFQAGPWRADAENALTVEQAGGLVQCRIDAHAQPGSLGDRLARTILAVDVAIAEAAAVAQEVVVDRTVEAVLDAAYLTIALARADVAAGGTAVADAWGKLHVPFAVIALGVSLVGKDAGGADLCQVAGKFAFQRAILDPAEIHLIIGTEYTQVGAPRVIFVIAHAAIAGDAAVHLMGNERAEFLVHVGALVEAVAALVVAGHHRHVLQVAVTAFLAYRAIMRVVDHQPLDDAGAERLGFLIVDGNPAVVGRRGHAGHDQAAAGVVLIAVLLDRTLAAGAHATQRGVPA